jgi:hypothetical protein
MTIINHEWLDTAEQRAQMAANVTLPIDQFLALIAVARNGLRPRLAAITPNDVRAACRAQQPSSAAQGAKDE